jgi:hypothetical protein
MTTNTPPTFYFLMPASPHSRCSPPAPPPDGGAHIYLSMFIHTLSTCAIRPFINVSLASAFGIRDFTLMTLLFSSTAWLCMIDPITPGTFFPFVRFFSHYGVLCTFSLPCAFLYAHTRLQFGTFFFFVCCPSVYLFVPVRRGRVMMEYERVLRTKKCVYKICVVTMMWSKKQ